MVRRRVRSRPIHGSFMFAYNHVMWANMTCTHRLDDSGGTQTERWWATTLDSEKMQTTLGGRACFPTCAALIDREGQVR